MILFKKATDIHKYIDSQQKNGSSVGFIPTMGALHQGHISLVEMSKMSNQFTVCSLFVNPTQFNDPKDFEKYPVTLEKDIAMLEAVGCDALFLPAVTDMYPEAGTNNQALKGLLTTKHYELGYLEEILEGKFRPGHFQGVCMIMQRLLEIILPDNLYLGQKDYQQCMVIRKLIDLIGLENSIKVTICPTLRETDGLAMSSRNMRLNMKERKTATSIYQCLELIRDNLQSESLSVLKMKAGILLNAEGFKIDYFEIVDANTLSKISDTEFAGQSGKKKMVALVAAFLNEVRLIDNMILN